MSHPIKCIALESHGRVPRATNPRVLRLRAIMGIQWIGFYKGQDDHVISPVGVEKISGLQGLLLQAASINKSPHMYSFEKGNPSSSPASDAVQLACYADMKLSTGTGLPSRL